MCDHTTIHPYLHYTVLARDCYTWPLKDWAKKPAPHGAPFVNIFVVEISEISFFI